MKTVKLIPFIFASALLPFIFVMIFPYNGTSSMPEGLYLRLPAWNIGVGDIVQADSPMVDEYLGSHAKGNLIKHVTAIENGMYELQGETLLSYDSDFFGMVGKERIKAELIPVLIL